MSISKKPGVQCLTILFVMVFIVLRVTQYWSPVPSIVRRDMGGRRFAEKLILNVPSLLDKGIFEVKDDTSLPKIKFSGILLFTLLPGFLILLYKRGTYFYKNNFFDENRIFNRLCSLRL